MPVTCVECARLRAEQQAASADYEAAKRALENYHTGAADSIDLLEAASCAKTFYQAAQQLNDATFRLRHHHNTHGAPDEPRSASMSAGV